MEKLDKKTLEAFIKKHGWLKFAEVNAPTGRQHMYMTPAGNIAAVVYDLKGESLGFGQLITAPMPGPGGPLFRAK